MVQQSIKIKEGKLKDIELPSLWLRERVVGDNFVDKITFKDYMSQLY